MMKCSKKRKMNIWMANHHMQKRHLEKKAMRKASLLTKEKFISSLQNKTWFQCSIRSKTIIKKAIKL